MTRNRFVVLALAGSILVPAAPATADTVSADASAITGLGLDGLAGSVAKALKLDASQRPAATGIRVGILSSGIEPAVFPESIRSQAINVYTSLPGDAVGYGTYAASVALQYDPTATIYSYPVYRGGKMNIGALTAGLAWAANSTKALDVVLLAFPPSEFLDPTSAAMAAGEWDAMSAALADYALQGDRGPVFGAPTNGTLLNQLALTLPPSQRGLINRFSWNANQWSLARQRIAALNKAGLAVVSPAGDLGPALQTTFGLANLPEVVTVGGFNGSGVSAQSGSGPSIDGRVKPDLLAPTGLVGLLPAGSTLAKSLAGLLDPTLQPAWSAGEPLTDARARLDTSITAAAGVAMAMGGMTVEGYRDITRQRGALTAASAPLEGVPVWRQGAGVMRRMPSRAFAESRALALGHADLGAEPETGAWSSTVGFANGSPTSASIALADFGGVTPQATTETRALADGQAPPVSARVSDSGIEVSLPLGNDRYQGGLYCGYSTIGIPTTGAEADPSVSAHGIPEGTEQVPTCLVEGTRFRTHAFYIHDTPAENLTFGLLPALPAGKNLLHKPMTMLPLDPLATKIFFKVTGVDGNAYFPNVPPGYYNIRQWSDYGAPITQTVRDAVTGAPVVQNSDIGEKVAYQSVPALVLSPLCSDSVSSLVPEEEPSPCTQAALEKVFGEGAVAFERPTWTYLVTVAPGVVIRIAFDRFKKMPGTAVSSRVIDLIEAGDFTSITEQLRAVRADWLPPAMKTARYKTWSFGPTAGGTAATFNPALAPTGSAPVVGISSYPFNLTTPNYKAHMSLDFSYEIANATIVILVQAGDDVAVGAVTPSLSAQVPGLASTQALSLKNLLETGRRTGRAHFDFELLPRGASNGTIWMLFIPPVNSVVASASVSDMMFEMDTWTNDLWPADTFADPADLVGTNPDKPGTVAGHSFTVHPNYSTRQMATSGCRAVTARGVSANVCEDWTVLVHSPGDDAETFAVADKVTGASVNGALASTGGTLFDPRRGVHDFTSVLAYASKTVGALELSVAATNAFKTNGRFWEQLAMTKAFLAGAPKALEFQIVDNTVGRASARLGVPHVYGGARVAPYVPFEAHAEVIDL